ncbi:MAG: hypothetical protein PHD61_02580 [Bacteroidales bacterium]|nr:hypothetical protein [Bacteroidales bacterium]
MSCCIPFGCKRDAGRVNLHSFPDKTWSRFEKQTFHLNIVNTSFPYDMMLILRHTEDYPFENLYLHIIMQMPGGEERIMERNFMVKNPGGAFISPVNKEGCHEMIFSLYKELHFADKGTCSVEIENLIPKTEITGIVELGISLQPSPSP